jgi:hypothetical protein
MALTLKGVSMGVGGVKNDVMMNPNLKFKCQKDTHLYEKRKVGETDSRSIFLRLYSLGCGLRENKFFLFIFLSFLSFYFLSQIILFCIIYLLPDAQNLARKDVFEPI